MTLAMHAASVAYSAETRRPSRAICCRRVPNQAACPNQLILVNAATHTLSTRKKQKKSSFEHTSMSVSVRRLADDDDHCCCCVWHGRNADSARHPKLSTMTSGHVRECEKSGESIHGVEGVFSGGLRRPPLKLIRAHLRAHRGSSSKNEQV